MTFLINVPGRFTSELALLDVETRKVPTEGYVMQNGEPLRNRWQAFLVGLARDGQIVLVDEPGEKHLLAAARYHLKLHRAIAYSATRQFDEMILKGRFTNARRAHEPAPFYPAMPGADSLTWSCHKHGERIERVGDLPSKEVPKAWADGRTRPVLVHLLRDAAELILQYGEPDLLARQYLRGLMRDYEFSANRIRYAKVLADPFAVA